MKKLVFVLALLGVSAQINAQISAYFNYGVFNVPQQKPFLETYFTIIGSSFKLKRVLNGYQSTAFVSLSIYKGDSIVKAAKYNLKGPLLTDTANRPSFIDNQRYALANGQYRFEISLSDVNNPAKKPFTFKENVNINYSRYSLQGSSVQALEKFSKANGQSNISKSGMDLIPYNINYYDNSQNTLQFYFETYNADTILGKQKPFIYSYYIERDANLEKMMGLSGFKKLQAAAVNPLLGQFDISKLPSGNYNLVIDVKDENNILQFQKKWFFQRQNNQLATVSAKETSEEDVKSFFGNFNNTDSLKMFVECLWPISSSTDRERQINQTVKKDPDLMKKYIVDFWTRRAADTANAFGMWMDYYKRVTDVQKLFRCGKQKGYFTDRGRVYLQYGIPNQRGMVPNDANTFPYEMWQYYRIKDESTGQFFTNKKFVFVNRQIADDCYMLIHSDMRGEIANEQWRFELTKRNMDGIQNGKGDLPANNSNYQFDDMFNSPR
jgi:GWxTD domain-containing protein